MACCRRGREEDEKQAVDGTRKKETQVKEFLFFNYFWLCWVFVVAHGLSLVAASGGYSSLQCAGFSLWWLLC